MDGAGIVPLVLVALLSHRGFLLLLFFGLRQHRFGFVAGRINSNEAKHSVPQSATELLHQLLEFNVGHRANGFVGGSLDGLWIDI